MARTATAKTTAPKEKKVKSTKSGEKKAPTAYQLFMKNELARLKAENPESTHKDRFKQAAANWAGAKENTKKKD